jgi:hypothetical protein
MAVGDGPVGYTRSFWLTIIQSVTDTVIGNRSTDRTDALMGRQPTGHPRRRETGGFTSARVTERI